LHRRSEHSENCKKPGGMIPNPALATFLDPDDVPDNMAEEIPDPGVAIGHGHEVKLQMLAFWCNYITWTNRTWNPAQATVANLTDLFAFKKQLETRLKEDNPKFPDKWTESKKARSIIEDMDEWIEASYGDRFPLSYIVRENDDVPTGRANGYYPLGTPSYIDNLNTRLSHYDANGNYVPDYSNHNSKVWEMIFAVTHHTTAYSWVKAFKTYRDGRGAMLSLKSHYLGASHVNSVKVVADNVLNKIYWTGNGQNFTWDIFTSKLNDAFVDLEENGEPQSDEAKVRKLLSKIQDQKLAVAVSTIKASATMKLDYQEEALDFLKGQVDEIYGAREEYQQNCRISQLNSGGRGTEGGQGRWNQGGGSGGQSNNNRGGGGRYGGRFGGRGRSAGRSGRGTGRGRDGQRYSSTGVPLHNGTYPFAVWQSFTAEEKDIVNNLRDQRGNSANQSGTARSISQVENSESAAPDSHRQRTDDTTPTYHGGSSMMRGGNSQQRNNNNN